MKIQNPLCSFKLTENKKNKKTNKKAIQKTKIDHLI